MDGGPAAPAPVAPCRHNRRLRQKTTKARMTVLPLYIAPTRFDDADAALAQVRRIYDGSIAHLRGTLQRFVAGEDVGDHVRACYPFVRVHTSTVARADSRLAYGFVARPGTYETTLTRPDLLGNYYREQFELLLRNHGVALEVGTSGQPIPVHFSLAEGDHIIEAVLSFGGELVSAYRAVERRFSVGRNVRESFGCFCGGGGEGEKKGYEKK